MILRNTRKFRMICLLNPYWSCHSFHKPVGAINRFAFMYLSYLVLTHIDIVCIYNWRHIVLNGALQTIPNSCYNYIFHDVSKFCCSSHVSWEDLFSRRSHSHDLNLSLNRLVSQLRYKTLDVFVTLILLCGSSLRPIYW